MNSVILIYSFWYNDWSESANCLASIHSVLHSLLYLGSINTSRFKNICSISAFLCRMNGQGVEMEDLAQGFWESSWKGSSHLASTLCPLSVLRLGCDVFSTHTLLWRWKPHAKDGRGESPMGRISMPLWCRLVSPWPPASSLLLIWETNKIVLLKLLWFGSSHFLRV